MSDVVEVVLNLPFTLRQDDVKDPAYIADTVASSSHAILLVHCMLATPTYPVINRPSRHIVDAIFFSFA